MNKNLKFITLVMIIILIIALLVIAATYFSRRRITDTKTPYVLNNSGESTQVKIKPSVASGDFVEISSTSEGEHLPKELTSSGEEDIDEPQIDVPKITTDIKLEGSDGNITISSGNDGHENEIVNNTEVSTTPNTEPIIISTTEASNQEKQQILDELDDALQGLLEAVGKVPTVDEDRLNASLQESEVQP